MVSKTDRASKSSAADGTRKLTIILLLCFAVTWTFLPQIQSLFVNIIFAN